MNLFWFRRDLRLEDNHALYEALKSGKTLPIFIFDTEILEGLPTHDKRVNFIYDQLKTIQQSLKKLGASLFVYHGKPLDVFQQLIQEYTIEKVFYNQDFEPYAIQRDNEIHAFLQSQNIECKGFIDHIIFPPYFILKADNTPYTVFTPYAKKWKLHLQEKALPTYPSEAHLHQFHSKPFDIPALSTFGFSPTSYEADYDFSPRFLQSYESQRNFPALKSSHLGVHLRFGTVSIRKIVREAREYPAFLNELIWREFFIQILYHFPQVVHQSFKPKYDALVWRNNEEEFTLWKQGKTGYPIVDAGMRELQKTGFMHNRVRMIAASFLCKHLLIDWRWGEAYFAEQLLDFEWASNNGNWQWASGSGCDAAPYFRVFNPTLQTQKFDPQGLYIQRWIPELQTLQYPTPIVEHAYARNRAIATYKKYLNAN